MKKTRRPRKPTQQASPNEQKLEMLTSRASNAYGQIHQEMSRGMLMFKRAMSGRKMAKSPSNMVDEAKRAVERAVRLTDALRRDLLVLPLLMNAIATEPSDPGMVAPVPPQPTQIPGVGPSLLEV